MIQYVSFSGGRTSAYLVKLMEDFKKDCPSLDIRYVFMDTGAEHHDTYRFIKSVVAHLNIDLVCLRLVINPVLGEGNNFKKINVRDISPDPTMWAEMLKKYGSPAVNIPFCTARLKTEPYENFIKEDSKGEDYMTWLGIRADEPSRLKPKEKIGYLANLCDLEKQDILDYWSKFDFDLTIPENLGNCTFCIKKRVEKIALAERYEPELAAEWASLVESEEVRTENRVLKDHAMYRGRAKFSQVIKMFEDISTRDLERKVFKSKSFDAGSCSESCEALT